MTTLLLLFFLRLVKLMSWLGRLKRSYEASHVKSLFPLLLLTGYSFIGGALFFLLESQGEADFFQVPADPSLRAAGEKMNPS